MSEPILTKYNIDGFELFFTSDKKIWASQSAVGRMCNCSETKIRSFFKVLNLKDSAKLNFWYTNTNAHGGTQSKLYGVYLISKCLAFFNTSLLINLLELDILESEKHTIYDCLNEHYLDIQSKNILKVKVKKASKKYLYIIQCTHTKVIKIGVSSNPTARLATLQTGFPYKLKIERSYTVTEHFKVEKYLHNQLHTFRLHGEWFSEQALQQVSYLVAIYKSSDETNLI